MGTSGRTDAEQAALDWLHALLPSRQASEASADIRRDVVHGAVQLSNSADISPLAALVLIHRNCTRSPEARDRDDALRTVRAVAQADRGDINSRIGRGQLGEDVLTVAAARAGEALSGFGFSSDEMPAAAYARVVMRNIGLRNPQYEATSHDATMLAMLKGAATRKGIVTPEGVIDADTLARELGLRSPAAVPDAALPVVSPETLARLPVAVGNTAEERGLHSSGAPTSDAGDASRLQPGQREHNLIGRGEP